jgi:DNA-binding CsgD family transcriptional regulator
MQFTQLVAMSSVVRRLCCVPLVPTHDWCDRAAGAIAHAFEPCVIVLAGLRCGIRCHEPQIEALGIGSSSTAEGTPLASLSTILRSRPGAFAHVMPLMGRHNGHAVCDRACVLTRPGELAACNAFWAGLNVGDHLIGLTRGGWASDRWLVCLAASRPPDRALDPASIMVVRIAMDELALRASIALAPIVHGDRHWITPSESQVLDLLIMGKSVQEAANMLGRSRHTVHDHVKSLYRKLNTRNRGELVARALGHLQEPAAAPVHPQPPMPEPQDPIAVPCAHPSPRA